MRSDGDSCLKVAEGRLTSMERISIGAVIMKIMSKTKTTSTKGVTLMSERVVFEGLLRRDSSSAVTEPPDELPWFDSLPELFTCKTVSVLGEVSLYDTNIL